MKRILDYYKRNTIGTFEQIAKSEPEKTALHENNMISFLMFNLQMLNAIVSLIFYEVFKLELRHSLLGIAFFLICGLSHLSINILSNKRIISIKQFNYIFVVFLLLESYIVFFSAYNKFSVLYWLFLIITFIPISISSNKLTNATVVFIFISTLAIALFKGENFHVKIDDSFLMFFAFEIFLSLFVIWTIGQGITSYPRTRANK